MIDRVSSDTQIWLFAYGTLRDPEVQEQIFGRRCLTRADSLVGFRLELVAISNPEVVRISGSAEHPGLVRTDKPGDIVVGLALAITDDELTAADAYEASDYIRTAVTLASGTEAFVYVAKSGERSGGMAAAKLLPHTPAPHRHTRAAISGRHSAATAHQPAGEIAHASREDQSSQHLASPSWVQARSLRLRSATLDGPWCARA